MVKGGYEGQLLLLIVFEPWLGRLRQIQVAMETKLEECLGGKVLVAGGHTNPGALSFSPPFFHPVPLFWGKYPYLGHSPISARAYLVRCVRCTHRVCLLDLCCYLR